MNADSTYRPTPKGDDCFLLDQDFGICWGQVELVSADYSGEGETTYACQGHKHVVDFTKDEYVPPPDK